MPAFADAITPQLLIDWTMSALIIAFSIGCALHALLNKRESRSALGWVALCLIAPVFGPLFYLVFGINRAVSPHTSDAADASLQAQPKSTAIAGNDVAPLFDAHEALEEMLHEVGAAQHCIVMSQYIFEGDGIGERMIDALDCAAQRGVGVYVLLDRFGALYSRRNAIRRLRKTAVHVAAFSPFRLHEFPPRLNLRNHRKMLVVDGSIAFVSGMNIRNGYLRSRRHPQGSIRELHFRLRGPIITALSEQFALDWQFCTGSRPGVTIHEAKPAGKTQCRLVVDGPDNSEDLLTLSLIEAIANARRRVAIVSPYFLPPREIVAVLQVAARNGVAVEVIVPARNNLPYVRWAMLHAYPDLLRYGVQVWEQPGTFDHSKLVLVDDALAIIGSLNIDPRSLRLNFELGIEVEDATLGQQLAAYVDDLLSRAAPVHAQELANQRLWRRLRNAIAWLATPYL